jgi:ankyrin repeat protein
MKNLLKEFKGLLEESDDFPTDELRDYYLVPAKALLASNPTITNYTYDDQTALMMIIKRIIKNNHHIRTIHLNILAWELIAQTPKEMLNYQDREGNSAAHLTCQMECFSVGLLDLMRQTGVNFSLQNKKGETPLMLVADSDSLDDLKFIHAYTSQPAINFKDSLTGATALHRAVKSKKMNNIFFLLENGASVFEKDNMGMTVLDYISNKDFIKRGNPHFVIELKKMMKVFAEKEVAEKTIEGFIKKKPKD